MTTIEKNVCIAEMLGAVIKGYDSKGNWVEGIQYNFIGTKRAHKWYMPFLSTKTSIISYQVLYADDELRFHSDANWQFEAIDWVEKQNVIGAEYASNYNFISSCFSCEIETTGYRSSTIINVENQNRKEAIFEALYQFSKYMKENGSK